MNTLTQHLRSVLAELDAINSPDDAYRCVFSTFSKCKLKRNETWRGRLVQWIDRAMCNDCA